jgi:hypothetical protein
MPLPQFELSNSQYRFLAEAELRRLPDPAVGEEARQDWSARGLDPQDVELDLPELMVLGLVVREADHLSLTALGSAVHHRAEHESAQEQLAAVARLAVAAQERDPVLASAVRRLAQGGISLDEALGEVVRGD